MMVTILSTLPGGKGLTRTYSIHDRQWRNPHFYLPDCVEWRITQYRRFYRYSREYARVNRHARKYGNFYFHPRIFTRPVYDHEPNFIPVSGEDWSSYWTDDDVPF